MQTTLPHYLKPDVEAIQLTCSPALKRSHIWRKDSLRYFFNFHFWTELSLKRICLLHGIVTVFHDVHTC
jgi:hypothetical protein